MADVGDLNDMAHQFKDALVESLDTIPDMESGLVGAPARVFVSPGLPVWDCCEQLAIHPPVIEEGTTSPGGFDAGRRFKLARITHVTFIATITRCIPTELEPPTADLEAAAEQIHADGWAIWNGIYNRMRAGELLPICSELFFDGINAVAPSGGCAGWTVTLRGRLDGYEELLGS